jgi:hypothetical protein
MAKKIPIVKYTSRDFNSIKNELVEYSKRYYPNSFSDFNEASFGSLMLDTVSYAGDVLSFYLDYQFNESFLNTASEFDNILKISNQLGYKYGPRSTAYGELTMYIAVPTNSTSTGPDLNYLPILKRGATFSSSGGLLFTLLQDVDFSQSTNEVVVSKVDTTTGTPTEYAVKTKGIVQSGFYTQKNISVGAFQRFLKLDMSDTEVLEIVSVFDSDGNQYYEVDHLSQDVIFREIPNFNFQTDGVPSILKPFPVPRRFIVNRTRNTTFLQFGYGSEDQLTTDTILDPAQVTLQMHAKTYFSDTAFDPTNLIKSDKFGVSPSNTTLTITYRKANAATSNVASNTITKVVNSSYTFPNLLNTTTGQRLTVQNSLEVTNEQLLVGEVRLDQAEELRQNTIGFYAAQNRAVSLLDYQSLIYAIPSNYGRVKRCYITQDNDSFKRNINIYIISETNSGTLTTAPAILKDNIKTWLTQYKMINDTIDILDAVVVNVGVDFNVIVSPDYDRVEVLNRALSAVRTQLFKKTDIGESFSIANIYNILNKLPGVLDTTSVTVSSKSGGVYSTSVLNIDKLLTYDGKYVKCPKNVIYEVKFPLIDVKGTIS